MIINNFNPSTNINAYEKYDKTYHPFIILRLHIAISGETSDNRL